MSTQQNRQIRELVDGLSQRPDRPMPTLRPEEPRGGIPARRGYVERAYQPGSAAGDTAGIAGPLTEVPDTRTYHDDVRYPMYSSDHLLAVEICPLASMKMLDAEEREVVMNFAPPSSVGS